MISVPPARVAGMAESRRLRISWFGGPVFAAARPVTATAATAATGNIGTSFDVVYGPGRSDGETLPELLSDDTLIRALDRVASMPGVERDRSRCAMNRFGDSEREADQRRTGALLGLIVILSLAIAGVVLVRELGNESRLEDCLLQGRTNCAPIEVPQQR
jgi:hypothetical protein